VHLPAQPYPSWAKRRAFVREVVDGLHALPGTEAAAAGSGLPFTSSQAQTDMHVLGRAPEAPDQREGVFVERVTPQTFRTLGLPIRAGRAFSDDDRADGHQVLIINEAAARAYFRGENPLGQTITLDFEMDSTGRDPVVPRGEIVGIVGNAKRADLSAPADPTVYMPYEQASVRSVVFVTRTTAEAGTLLAAARRVVFEADPDVPVFNTGTLLDDVRSSIARPALDAWLISAFATVALVLALIGIYGLISYSVRERRREMGIRMALGARQAQVVRLVLAGGLQLAIVGLALGLTAAMAGSRLIQTLLYGVTAIDAPTYAAVAVGLISVAALASWIPARRAAMVEPTVAMRSE